MMFASRIQCDQAMLRCDEEDPDTLLPMIETPDVSTRSVCTRASINRYIRIFGCAILLAFFSWKAFTTKNGHIAKLHHQTLQPVVLSQQTSILPFISVMPFGVLGTQLTTGRELREMSSRPDKSTAVVDPAGMLLIHHHGPAWAGLDKNGSIWNGACGAIYAWAGLDKNLTFPIGVKNAIQSVGDAKFHKYNDHTIIHVAGPDLRHTTNVTTQSVVQMLGQAYASIFTQFLSSGAKTLRLLPLSSETVVGKWKNVLPKITFDALSQGFSSLSAQDRQKLHQMANEPFQLCIFSEEDWELYRSACPMCATYSATTRSKHKACLEGRDCPEVSAHFRQLPTPAPSPAPTPVPTPAPKPTPSSSAFIAFPLMLGIIAAVVVMSIIHCYYIYIDKSSVTVTYKLATEMMDVMSDVNNAIIIYLDKKENPNIKTIAAVIAVLCTASFFVASIYRFCTFEPRRKQIDDELSQGLKEDIAEHAFHQVQNEKKRKHKELEDLIAVDEAKIDVRCGLLEDVPSAIFNAFVVGKKIKAGLTMRMTSQMVALLVSCIGLFKTLLIMLQAVKTLKQHRYRLELREKAEAQCDNTRVEKGTDVCWHVHQLEKTLPAPSDQFEYEDLYRVVLSGLYQHEGKPDMEVTPAADVQAEAINAANAANAATEETAKKLKEAEEEAEKKLDAAKAETAKAQEEAAPTKYYFWRTYFLSDIWLFETTEKEYTTNATYRWSGAMSKTRGNVYYVNSTDEWIYRTIEYPKLIASSWLSPYVGYSYGYFKSKKIRSGRYDVSMADLCD